MAEQSTPFPHEVSLMGDLESKWHDFKDEWEDYVNCNGTNSTKDKTVQV